SSALAYSTTYTARVTTGVEDLAGNNLASDQVWTFTTEPEPDTTPPTVTAVTPVEDATDVDPGVNATATFSEPVDAGSVNATTFQLSGPEGLVSGVVILSGQTATFNPSSPLSYDTAYIARVTTGVEDLAGNSMTSDRVWTFTTEPEPDTTPPSVTAESPVDGAENVDRDVNLTATFSEQVDPSTVNGTTFLLGDGSAEVSGTVSLSEQTATFNPSSPLAYSTTYTARVTTGVEDLAGNNMASDRIWTFTTEPAPDTTPPTVTSFTPPDGSSSVDPAATPTATFSEPVDPSSVNETTFQVTGGGGDLSGTVTLSGQTATFHPSTPLDFSATYTARVTTGVQDLAGNALSSEVAWTFTTAPEPDSTPPTVTGMVPQDGASDVDFSTSVSATFSEAVDPSSVTAASFLVTGPGDQAVPGTVSVDGAAVTFTPAEPLAPNTLHTVTTTTEVQDLQGNHLGSDVAWSFTTTHVPPLADAGPNQEVMIGSTVTLDGTGSSDPEGEPVDYLWTQIRGADMTGGTGVLTGPTPTFTAPLLPDRLEFDLTVSDGDLTSVTDRVRIDVILLDVAQERQGDTSDRGE
ncbi:MAG TPA: Ig-like domain-containing protein, partial [Candidatus Eisenbacteria bacterium]|nr:Ig-like domain-containing protein [Candidatus Eisenbacteria bacterium]